MKKRLASSFLLIIFSSVTWAQNFIGISSSNYGGIHAVLMNPANLAENEHKFFINLAAVGGEVQNNYLKWGAPYSILRMGTNTVPSQYLSSSGKPIWRPNYYHLNGRVQNAKLFINAEFRGPAFQYSSKEKGFGIAAGQRFRIMGSLSNADPVILQLIGTGTKNINLQGINYQNQKAILDIGGFNEFYLSFAKVIKEENTRKYKIGITLKRILSNLNLSLNADKLKYTISPTDASNQYQNILGVDAVGSYFSAAPDNQDINLSWIMKQMSTLKAIGKGFGADIGFTYEYGSEKRGIKRSNEVSPYKLKLGVSLTDIGFVSYNSPTEVRGGEINTTGLNIAPATFFRLRSIDQFVDVMENEFIPVSSFNFYRILMPAKLQAQADYLVKDGFYISAAWRQALLPHKRVGPSAFSGISVIPRFEKQNLEFAFPVSLDQDYTNFNFGATMRAGPFFFGIDNLTGWLNIGKPKSLSIHTGLLFGFGKSKEKNSMLDCYYDPNAKIRRPFLPKLFRRK